MPHSICLQDISLASIQAAQERIAGAALATPLLALNADSGGGQIYLKLENLQAIGSFKIRGASNAMACLSEQQRAQGVYTASAGNMAQGLAWNARRLGLPCAVIVPDHAPQAKLGAVENLGADIIKVPFERWWQVLTQHHYPGLPGVFIHPVSHADVIAGNATIGLELLAAQSDIDTIVVPFGGGGLSCGIAIAAKALNPSVRVIACEVDTAAPLAASLKAGRPVPVDYQASFVDGIGGASVLEEMWPLISQVIDDCCVVSLQEIAAALRLLVKAHHVVAEGAGAAALAAALSGRVPGQHIACIVSGGNIDSAKLADLLLGKIP